MHQRTVFVLAIVTLYVPLSMFFPVWTSLNLLTDLLRAVILDVTKRRERKREATPTACLSYIPSEKKNKTEISGCGSFVAAYFKTATSLHCLRILQSPEKNTAETADLACSF